MRLIDADALKQAVNERYHDPWIDMLIRNATTVDTVPAVRCCDCRYFTEHMEVGMCKRIADKPILPINYDAFCSYGERKEEEK